MAGCAGCRVERLRRQLPRAAERAAGIVVDIQARGVEEQGQVDDEGEGCSGYAEED